MATLFLQDKKDLDPTSYKRNIRHFYLFPEALAFFFFLLPQWNISPISFVFYFRHPRISMIFSNSSLFQTDHCQVLLSTSYRYIHPPTPCAIQNKPLTYIVPTPPTNTLEYPSFEFNWKHQRYVQSKDKIWYQSLEYWGWKSRGICHVLQQRMVKKKARLKQIRTTNRRKSKRRKKMRKRKRWKRMLRARMTGKP